MPMRRAAAMVLGIALCGALPLGSQAPVARSAAVQVPLGLPPLPPGTPEPSPQLVALGKRLFYDPILSADQTIACSSCHDPRFGFADRNRVSTGVGGQRGTRNAPTIANV